MVGVAPPADEGYCLSLLFKLFTSRSWETRRVLVAEATGVAPVAGMTEQ